jgi:hypothetical protein
MMKIIAVNISKAIAEGQKDSTGSYKKSMGFKH